MNRSNEKETDRFLSNYSDEVFTNALTLREIIFKNLPGIQEQVDLPARIIGYCYGNKYSELICTIIPSKKGIKLGFNKGPDLQDPEQLLQGTGKISRYVEIKTKDDINTKAITALLKQGFKLYRERIGN